MSKKSLSNRRKVYRWFMVRKLFLKKKTHSSSIRINGRLCSVAIRDCGPEFSCVNGACQDNITVLVENQLIENVNEAIA